MPRNIVITAANDLYLPLALGLLRSLRDLKFSVPFDIGFLDVGLGEEAKASIAAFGATIVPARADIDYPDREFVGTAIPRLPFDDSAPLSARLFPRL